MVKTGLVRESVDFFKFASAGPDGRQLPKDYDKVLVAFQTFLKHLAFSTNS